MPNTHHPPLVDPVCGMTVKPADAATTVKYEREVYYFCSQRCVAQFKSDPEKFLVSRPSNPWQFEGKLRLRRRAR